MISTICPTSNNSLTFNVVGGDAFRQDRVTNRRSLYTFLSIISFVTQLQFQLKSQTIVAFPFVLASLALSLWTFRIWIARNSSDLFTSHGMWERRNCCCSMSASLWAFRTIHHRFCSEKSQCENGSSNSALAAPPRVDCGLLTWSNDGARPCNKDWSHLHVDGSVSPLTMQVSLKKPSLFPYFALRNDGFCLNASAQTPCIYAFLFFFRFFVLEVCCFNKTKER